MSAESSGARPGLGPPLGGPTGGGAAGRVIVPPVASGGTETRLPIFESVESDWFRRHRHGVDAPAGDRPTVAWSSPADEGWRAAEAASEPVSDGLTAAGLPQRIPKANLVPGRAGLPGAPPAQPAPARSAAQAQARLAGFQRGVRDARQAAAAEAHDAVAGNLPPGADAHQDADAPSGAVKAQMGADAQQGTAEAQQGTAEANGQAEGNGQAG